MWRYLIWSLRLRRLEYRIAELPIFLIPTLLTISDAGAFRSLVLWEGLLIFLFLFAFGDLLNCLADRDLDAVYKKHLAEAVDGIGARGVIVQAALSAVAAAGLTIHVAWHLERWLLVPLVLGGLFVAYAYSVPPFRWKGRGLWQLGFYWLGLFTGPMVFTALLFEPRPAWGVVAVAVFYGLMQTGVVLVNTAEDFPEDRQLGVRTVIVALGLPQGLALAAVLASVGSTGLVSSLVLLFVGREFHGPGYLGLLPLLLVGVAVCYAIARLSVRVRAADEPQAIELVRRGARWVPVWITSLALASLLAAVAYRMYVAPPLGDIR